MASGPPPAPYAIAPMVSEAYRQTLADHQAVLRAGGLWVLLALFGDFLADAGPLALLFLLVSWVGVSALTVHRIRALLAGDPPPALLAPLDRYVARYIATEILVGALAVLPTLAILPLLAPIAGGQIAVAAGTVAAILVFARLHLALVAAALGEPGVAIQRSWRATERVWPQAAVGLLACSAPLAMLAGGIGAAIAAAGAPLTGSGLATIAAFAQAAVLGAFLAESWRRLLGAPAAHRDGGRPPSA